MPSALSQCAPCNSIQTHKIHFPKYQIHIPKNKLAFGNTKSTGSALGAFSITDSRLASQFGGLHNLPTLGVGGNDVYEDLKQSFYVGSLPRWWLWRLLNLGYIGWFWLWRFSDTSSTGLSLSLWLEHFQWWLWGFWSVLIREVQEDEEQDLYSSSWMIQVLVVS